MKKVTVIAIGHQREDALKALQDLGVLHVRQVDKPAAPTAPAVAEQIKTLTTVIELLAAAPPAPSVSGCDSEKVVADIQQKRAACEQLAGQLAGERAQIAAARVWGEFDPARIAALAAHGVIVKLYQCMPGKMPTPPEGCLLHELARDKSSVAFAVVGRAPFTLDLTEVKPPAVPLSEMIRHADDIARQIARTTAEIAAQAGTLPALTAYARQLDDELACAETRDQTAQAGILVYLQGFMPADHVAAFERAAQAHAWGVVVEEPADDDPVPTLLRNPAWLRPVENVFKFIDTFPGYRERDISPVFYLFFSLFYAMLIGDAGYGFLFLCITAFVHWWKRKTIPRSPLYLMYVLNFATVIWGVLAGSYFSIPVAEHSLLRKFIVLDTASFEKTVYLCFIIALVHLALGHLWTAWRIINSWRAIEQVSWACVLVTMFFVANTLILSRPLPPWVIYFGAASILVALVFATWGKKGEDLIAAFIQFPFGIINCFGDIASYIRLFAVGFAGAATAQAFNGIAEQIGMNSVVAGFAVAFILVAGHALNMVLGLLSVIVHGLRLNTLEFSGHIGLEWSGSSYKPFARIHHD